MLYCFRWVSYGFIRAAHSSTTVDIVFYQVYEILKAHYAGFLRFIRVLQRQLHIDRALPLKSHVAGATGKG